MVHPLGVHLRTEDVDPAVHGVECLQALEHALPVVQGGQGRQYLDLAEGKDARFLPSSIGVVHPEHVVGEYLPEAQMIEVDRAYLARNNLTGIESQLDRLCASP